MYLPTPSQTIGPFFGFALPGLQGNELVPPGTSGALHIEGRVLDGEGNPVVDAMIEIWQAHRSGRYAHAEDQRDLPLDENFTGFGRCGTDAAGRFWFLTVKPGRVPDPAGTLQAPHVNVSVFARGLLQRVVTRIYFPDEVGANECDPVLCSIADPIARSTLVARAEDGLLRFDIHLQGERETAFFDI